MKRWSTALILCLLTALLFAQQTGAFRVTFSKTDVAQVLQALSVRTGANIVYSGKPDIPVTINILANNTEDAVKGAASAAGLTYRKVGSTFVVAAPEDMRKALRPYGNRVRFTLKNLKPADTAKLIEETYGDVSAEAAGDRLFVTAVPTDIVMVREFIEEREAEMLALQPKREIINLKHTEADKVSAVLKSLFPNLTIEPLAKANGGSLALSGPAAMLEEVIQIVRTLDVATPGATSEETFRIYDIKYSSAPILQKFLKEALPELQVLVGPESYSPRQPGFRPISGARIDGGSMSSGSGSSTGGNSGNGGSGSGSGTGGTVSTTGADLQGPVKEGEKAKTIVLRGTEAQIVSALRLLQQVDIKPQQVMVEVQVVDTSPERMQQLGFRWDWSNFNFFEGRPGSLINSGFLNTSRPAGFGQFSRLPWSVTGILDALITQKEAKLLANPKVQVLDGDEANIFIGDTIRARLAQTNSLGGQTIEIAEFPIGIILLLRPRVNGDGNITMRVHPVVSTVTDVDEDNVPQTSSREAETTVIVKDGETMVIGGLIRDEMTKTVTEVPILAKLPIVGELFRSRTTNRRHSEILVFITARVVKDTDAVVSKEKK